MMSMYDNREYRVPKAAREMVKRKGKRKRERKKKPLNIAASKASKSRGSTRPSTNPFPQPESKTQPKPYQYPFVRSVSPRSPQNNRGIKWHLPRRPLGILMSRDPPSATLTRLAPATVKTSQNRCPDTPDANAGNPPRKVCAWGAAVVPWQLGRRAGRRHRRS